MPGLKKCASLFNPEMNRCSAKEWHNEKLANFFDSIDDPVGRDWAARTISWVKENYPEVRDVLRGKPVAEDVIGLNSLGGINGSK